MTRLEALKELVEKVEAGGDPDSFGAVGAGTLRGYAECAYTGSLDAAKALHEAVLPGWGWEHGSQIVTGNSCASVYLPDRDNEKWKVFYSSSETPARAWLLAILRALIAQEEGQ